MGLFGSPLKNKKRTHRKPMTWLDKEAKNSDNLLHQTKDLPLIQAAIIRKRKMSHCKGVLTVTKDNEKIQIIWLSGYINERHKTMNFYLLHFLVQCDKLRGDLTI